MEHSNLLYLAFKAFKSAMTAEVDMEAKAASGDNLFFRGLVIQMTNPKAALHWVAIVAIGLGAGAPVWLGAALVICTTVLSLLGHLAYAITFSTAPVITFYRAGRRWIESALGAFFIFAAYKIALFRL